MAAIPTETVGLDETARKDPDLNANEDESRRIFDDGEEYFEYSGEEAKRVRWKMDLILLPMATFMDKAALTEASIFGIQKGLHLVHQQYSWANSIFYFGYLFAQYPCSILMQKLPIGRYFGVMMMLWGLTTTCTAVTKSFATLAVCRFFLGVFETCVSPVLTILIGQYWTRSEQPLRATLWWAGAGVGGFVADGITYAVSGGAWAGSKYETWQVVFLIFGPLTIGWGILLFCCLPTSPMTAWFLTERERKISVMRVVHNHTGIENRKYKLDQVKEALLDSHVWMLCAQSFLQCIPAGGLSAFGKLILTGMGFSSRRAVLLANPSHAVQLMSNVIAGAFASLIPNSRCAMMIFTNVIVLIGSVLLETLPSPRSLGALYAVHVNTVPYIMCMSLLSSNVGGFTKKATCGVMMFMSYAVGHIIAPQFFRSHEAPRYRTGFRAFYISVAMMIAIELVMLAQLWHRNRRKRNASVAPEAQTGISLDFQDLTDKQHPDFRYVY
ncbi:major facilitator superfamily domain-containing protein [Aspergillus avenaceus]|uniref:Major facilitator superfamily domain-containing protein n=1 Tax=Aspergillus avenaceus TaxID=36643 RepID=A0A5N6TZ63_ASPAV|nr:major facilitator superfamily domain-containing protein [Aspergillus avenaceus]